MKLVPVAGAHPLLEPLSEPLPAVLLKPDHATQLLASVPLSPPIGSQRHATQIRRANPNGAQNRPSPPNQKPRPPHRGFSPQPAAQPAVAAPPGSTTACWSSSLVPTAYAVLKLLSAAPQRPQRYLRATAGYSTARRRARWLSPPSIPPCSPQGGVTISAAVTATPPAAEHKLQGILTADAPEVRLFVEAPRGPGLKNERSNSPSTTIPALTFVVPCDSDQAEIAADDNQLGAAILSPAAGDAFSGSLKEIPIELPVEHSLASARQSPLSIDAPRPQSRPRAHRRTDGQAAR